VFYNTLKKKKVFYNTLKKKMEKMIVPW
jgi:hypothetical protein